MEIIHSYGDLKGGRWLRGNLHTHTTRSDGQCSLQEVVKNYASHGYDFLSITDHDLLADRELYESCADEAGDMILIAGNEVTANGPHIVHVDADRLIEPLEDRQDVIRQISDNHGFAIIVHPNAGGDGADHCPIELMEQWEGYLGIEILNSLRWSGEDAYALNKWDILLSQGRRVLGFANDDSHHPDMVAKGWNVAYVKDPSPQSVVAALTAGTFYASCGVTITDIRVDGRHIEIETEDAERIIAIADAGGSHSRCIDQVDDNVMKVDFPEESLFVRFECRGHGESFAWTQPFYRKTS